MVLESEIVLPKAVGESGTYRRAASSLIDTSTWISLKRGGISFDSGLFSGRGSQQVVRRSRREGGQAERQPTHFHTCWDDGTFIVDENCLRERGHVLIFEERIFPSQQLPQDDREATIKEQNYL